MAGDCVIGVDLGGTKIYTALAGADGQVLAEIKIPTEAAGGQTHVIARIVDSCREVRARAGVLGGRVAAVAVGAPGPLDTKSGVIHFAPNLKWHGVPLKQLLEEPLGVPVFLDNDANLAALGEYVYGAGRGTMDMVFITVSTGIGGGLILGGRLYRGASDSAGEIGHTVVLPDGPLCSCGNRGCLEAVASGTALAAQARELIGQGRGAGILAAAGGLEKLNAAAVFAAAAGGDSEATLLIERAGRCLGIAVANTANLLNPERVVIGGGVAENGDLLFAPVSREVARAALEPARSTIRIVKAALGGRAGVLGAVALALEKAAGGA